MKDRIFFKKEKKKNYLHDYLLRLLYYLLLRCVLWLYINQKKRNMIVTDRGGR